VEALEERIPLAALTQSGTTLIVSLNTTNESINIQSLGSNYQMWLASGSFTDGGITSGRVTGFGTSAVSVTSVGLSAYNKIQLVDSVGIQGTKITFANSFANAYSDSFEIILNDDTAVGIGEQSVVFDGVSSFGAFSLNVNTTRNIALINGNGTNVSTTDGSITLAANSAGTTSGNFVGVSMVNSTISATGTGAIQITGRGGNSSNNNYGISLITSSKIIGGTTGTAVSVNGTGGSSTGTNNYGVYLNDAVSGSPNVYISSNGGAVDVTGLGGGLSSSSSGNHGVYLQGVSRISAGGNGNITVSGTGGGGGSTADRGLFLSTGCSLVSSGGNINVTGVGTSSSGVLLAGLIQPGLNGTATVTGTGGTGVAFSSPGVIVTGSTAAITSSGGAVLVTGQGGGSGTGTSNQGVLVTSGGLISAGGMATVTVRGTGGQSAGTSLNDGVSVTGSGSRISSGGGPVEVTGTQSNNNHRSINVTSSGSITTATNGGAITLIGNNVEFDSTAIISSGTNSLTLKPKTAIAIDLGGADVSGSTLGFTDTELDRVTAGTLNIGDSTNSMINVTAAITRLAATHVNLSTAGNIVFNPGSLNTGGGNLVLNPGSTSSIQPISSGVDVSLSTGNLTFSPGADLAVPINGLSEDTNYRQLNLFGGVDLTGVDLILSGSHVPSPGQSFTIVKNDGADPITGTFNSMPEGFVIENFLGSAFSATLSYVGGSGNDVVLNVGTGNHPPVITSDGGGATANLSVSEAATTVTTVAATDIDVGQIVIYSIAGGADIVHFAIDSVTGILTFAILPDFEIPNDNNGDNIYEVIVQAMDNNNAVDTQTLYVTITNTNPSAPADSDLVNNTINEPSPFGIKDGDPVGITAVSFDPQGPSVTYSLLDSAGGRFAIHPTSGVVTVANKSLIDYETATSHNITIQASDGAGGVATTVFTITVNDVNEAPSLDTLFNYRIDENLPSDTVVTPLSATDPDVGDSHTFTLVPGIGDDENAYFVIVGNVLKTAASFDYELNPFFRIRIRTTDAGGLYTESSRDILVRDVNEAPTDVLLTTAGVPENTAIGTSIGTFSIIDPEANISSYTLVAGAGSEGNSSFTINGDSLKTAASFDFETQPSVSIRVRATDNGGLWFEKILNVPILNSSEAPSNIVLSATSVDENTPGGSVIATLSATDPDIGDTLTFSMEPGAGSQDNVSFYVVDGALKTWIYFDFETKSSYSIRLRATDSAGLYTESFFIITIIDSFDPPINILLSSDVIAENSPSGTVIGSFTSIDTDPGDSFTYSLVSGMGSSGNPSFTIVGDQLRSASVFDFESASSFNIRVRATDAANLYFEKEFVIQITDTIDAPTNVSLSGLIIPENSPSGTIVGLLSATDPDPGDTFTYSLVSGPGLEVNAFTIDGNALKSVDVFNFELKSSYAIRILATDSFGLTRENPFTITVSDVNEAPTNVRLTSGSGTGSTASVIESAPIGTSIATLTTTDPDQSDVFTYSLVTEAGSEGNAAFAIEGNALKSAVSFDALTQSTYNILVRATDAGGLYVDIPLVINITLANRAPTDIAISNSSVLEDQPIGTIVGAFFTVDANIPDSFVYSLVPGIGSADNASFSIDNDVIRTSEVFDYLTKSTYSVRIRSTDATGLYFEKPFTITIDQLNVAPTDITLSNMTVGENQPLYTVVGLLSATDSNVGESFSYNVVSQPFPAVTPPFGFDGDKLVTTASLNFEAQSSYSVLIRVTDSGGATFDKLFTISVTNVNDAPSSFVLSSQSVGENLPAGTLVATLSTTDEDVADSSFTYQLIPVVGSAGHTLFAFDGNLLKTVFPLDYEIQTSYTLRIRSTDPSGLWVEQTHIISVIDTSDSPTEILLSSDSVPENASLGTTIGTLSAIDPSSYDTFTFEFTTGAGSVDNASFQIVGTSLKLATSLNFEAKSAYTVRIRALDSTNNSVEQAFTIHVTNINEPPTAIQLSNASVAEGSPIGTSFGTFTTNDPDASSNISTTYTLLTISGFTDHTSFSLNGSSIKTEAIFDYEKKSAYTIRVRATDEGGFSVEQTFAISVNDIIELLTSGNFGWALKAGSTGLDQGKALTVDSFGNVIVVGDFENTVDFDPGSDTVPRTSLGSLDIFVAKYSSTGALLWAKSVGGSSGQRVDGVTVDSSGNIYFTGIFYGTANFDPGSGSHSITSVPTTGQDMYLCKLNSDGNFVWAKSFPGEGQLYPYGIAVDSFDNVHITGEIKGGPFDFDPSSNVFELESQEIQNGFVMKLTSSAQLLWAKQFGGPGSTVSIQDIAVDVNGNVYTTGSFTGTAYFDPGSLGVSLNSNGEEDVFISKLNSSGNLVGVQKMGGTHFDRGTDIAVDSSGNVFATGYFLSTTASFGTNILSASGLAAFVTMLDSSLSFLWSRKLGGGYTKATSIALDGDGNVYTTGFFNGTEDFDPGSGSQNLTSDGATDIFVSRLDSSGNSHSAKRLGGTNFDGVYDISIDSSGNVYTTGYFQGTADFNPNSGTGSANVANLTSVRGRDMFLSRLNQSYLAGAGTAVNGYLVGATAYFDANFNRTNDPNEPVTTTDSNGEFHLDVPLEFDTNSNGVLDDSEGQWIVFGGTDSSTGLPAVGKLIAPASWSVVTPLTTLVSTLVRNHSMTINDASNRVIEALGLPTTNLSTLDPIATTIAGDPQAPPIFAAHAHLQDTIAQALSLFAGAGPPPVGIDLANLLIESFASAIAAPSTTLNLNDPFEIEGILQSVQTSAGLALSNEVRSGASQVIAANNLLIDDIPISSGPGYLSQVAQVKIVSQGVISGQLQSAAAGTVNISDVVTNNTGSALTTQVSAAATPPTLILPAAVIAEANSASGAIVNFTVSATNLTGQIIPVVLSHPSGALYPIGLTTVTASATDNGLTTTANFTITVVDTIGPDLSQTENIYVNENAPGGAMVTFDLPTATDQVDSNPQVSCDASPGFFPAGENVVTCTATDSAGNIGTSQFSIFVGSAYNANIVITSGDRVYNGLAYTATASWRSDDPAPTLTVEYFSDSAGANAISPPKNAGTYYVRASAQSNSSNSPAQSALLPFTITPLLLSASATANSKTYDGTANAAVSINLSGIVVGDSVTGSASGTFDNKNVGVGKTVTMGPVSLSGAEAGNYTVGAAPNTTANITAASISAITGITANDKVYDATTAATLVTSGAGFTGILGSDALTVASSTGNFVDANVGNGKTVNITNLTLGGADADNYTLLNDTATTMANILAAGTVVNTQLFYRAIGTNTAIGNATNPTTRIDPSKLALQPGQTEASIEAASGGTANFIKYYTGFIAGINGLVVDIANTVGVPTDADFQFRTWNGVSGSPATSFALTSATPTVTNLGLVGSGSSRRMKIEFVDNAIKNTWLQVTVLANPLTTGLAANTVFYFGSAAGDVGAANSQSGLTGNFWQVSVSGADGSVVLANQTLANQATISNIYDVGKNLGVTGADRSQVLAQAQGPVLRFFNAPAPLPAMMMSSGDSESSSLAPVITSPSIDSKRIKRVDQFFEELGEGY
jgi:YDG domain/Cadherin domain/Beta-propeller repeat/HYR domain